MSFRSMVSPILPQRVKVLIRSIFRMSQEPMVEYTPNKASMVAIGSFDGFQVAYRRNTADENVIRESFSDDIYFSGVPEYTPAEEDIIIDIGAHIGTFSLLASVKAPRGKIYSIEACEDTFNFLRINVALNHRNNISVHHLAISDKKGSIKLHYAFGNWGHSIVSPLSDQGETVDCVTLSDFLETNRIAHCEYIKFNCEGAEFPILLSTPPEVLRRISNILVLYHCDLWTSNTERDIVSHLESSGFHCVVRPTDPQNGRIFISDQDLPRYGKVFRGWIVATRNT